MVDLRKDMKTARNAAKNKLRRVTEDMQNALIVLESSDSWTGDEHIYALDVVRRNLAEIAQRGHEMNAYSNAYNKVQELLADA